MTTFVMRLPLSESALCKETSLPVSTHQMARCESCNIALAPDYQSKLCRVCQNLHTLRNQRMTLANCASCKAVVQVPATQVAPPQPVICATCRQPRSQASPTRGNAQPTNPMIARPPAPNSVELDDMQFAAFIANAAAQFVHPAHIHPLYNERIGAPLKRPKSHYGPLPESRMKPVVNVPPPGTPHLNSRGEYLWPHLLPSRCSSVYPFPPLPTPQSMLPFVADHADSVAVSRWRQSSSLPTDWAAIATPVISPSVLVEPSSQSVSPAQIPPDNFSDQRKRTIRLCEMHGCSTILSPGHPFEMCSKHTSVADHPMRRMSTSSLPSDCLHPAHVPSLSSSLTDTLSPAIKPRLRVHTQSNGSIRIDPPVSATEVGSANESPSMLDSHLPTSRQAYSLSPAGSHKVDIGSQPRSLPAVVASNDRSMRLKTEPPHPKKQESTEMETEQMLRHIELLLQGHREARRMSKSSRGPSHGSTTEEAVRGAPELATGVIADVPVKDALHPLKQEGNVVAASESNTQDVPFTRSNDVDTSLSADGGVLMDISAEPTSDEAADTLMSHNHNQHDSAHYVGEINLNERQETSSATNTVSSPHSPHSSLSSKRTSPQTSPITQFGDLPNSSATQDGDGDLSDLTPLEGSTDEGESEIEMKESSSDDEEDIPLAKQLSLIKRRRFSSTICKPATKCSVRYCHNLLLPGTKRKPCESCRQKNSVLQNRRRAMTQVKQAECNAPQKQEKLPRIILIPPGRRTCISRWCYNVIGPNERRDMCKACRKHLRRRDDRTMTARDVLELVMADKRSLSRPAKKRRRDDSPLDDLEYPEDHNSRVTIKVRRKAPKPTAIIDTTPTAFQHISRLLECLHERFFGFLSAQAQYLRFKFSQGPKNDGFGPVLFNFDGEYSIVADPAGGPVDSTVKNVMSEIETTIGVKFREAGVYTCSDHSIVTRFGCLHEIQVEVPHILTSPTMEPSVPTPTGGLLVRRMAGEMEVHIAWDRRHKYFPGQKIALHFKLLG